MYSYGITGSSIDEFQDVDLAALANGHVLTYNSTSGKWEAVAPTGGGAVDLDDLTDVIIAGAAEFDTLEYNGTSWVNKHASVVTRVKNAEATTLNVGEVVYIFGASGDMATVKRADNDSDTTSSKTLGIVATSMAANAEGSVVTRGYVDGIDLSTGYTPGDILWLGESGGFTKTKPVSPEHLVFVGVVCRANANGIIYVAVQNGYELDELHNVSINPSTLADNDLLQYNSSNGQWENVTVATAVPAPSISLDALTDAAVSSPTIGHVLEYNGSDFANRSNRTPAVSLQRAVNGRRYTVANQVLQAIPGSNVGSCAVVTFVNACSITDLSIYLTSTYNGATTYTYRLGVYADNNGTPGALLADAGTITIATTATAGLKTVTLPTPVSVPANTPVWLLCAATHAGTVPSLTHYVTNMQPYSDYGLSNPVHTQAACFGYTTAAGTALPATFSFISPETQPIGVAVYATVSVP